MAFEPRTTSGGWPYLGGGGTFAQFVAGFKWMAETQEATFNLSMQDVMRAPKAPLGTTHLDSIGSGLWAQPFIGNAVPANGYPEGAEDGTLIASSSDPNNEIRQTYISGSGVWHRVRRAYKWTPWTKVTSDFTMKGTLTSEADLNTMTTTGYWSVFSGTVASALGLPDTRGGILEVITWGRYAAQIYHTLSGVWHRWQGSTAWHPWSKIGGNPDSDMSSLGADASLDTMTAPGRWAVLSGSSAQGLGLPGNGIPGVFEVIAWGGSRSFQRYLTGSGEWERWQGSTGWSAWSQTDSRDFDNRVGQVLDKRDAPPPVAGIKTLPVALSLGSSGSFGPTTATVRVPFRVNAPVTRWRLVIANRNPRYGLSGLALTDPFSFSGLHTGTAGAAGAATDLKRVAGIPAIPAGQSMTASQWVSNESIGDDRRVMLSFSYTGTAQPRGMAGGGWVSATAGQEAAVSPSGLAPVRELPFQMWVEVETPGDTPVLAVYGDSLSCGVGATTPVYDSWLSQYCRTVGAIPVHYAASGDYMGGWEDPAMLKWRQWKHLDRPDAVVWAMGSNDLGSGTVGLEEMQRRHAVIAPLLARFVSPVMYATTIMPRTKESEGFETNRRAYNSWLKTLPNGFRDVFDFAASISTDDDTIVASEDADGIHLTTRGYALNAASITRPVTRPRLATVASVAPIVQTTGWRSLPLLSGVTGTLLARRTGDEVWLRLINVAPPAGTYEVHIALLPASLAPDGEWFFIAHDEGAGSPPSVYGMASGNYLTWQRTTTHAATRPTTPQSGSIIYSTKAAFPAATNYPGTPA